MPESIVRRDHGAISLKTRLRESRDQGVERDQETAVATLTITLRDLLTKFWLPFL